MQQKLAAVLQELVGDDNRNGDANADGFGGARSPDAMQAAADYGLDQGYITPYVTGGGATSAWGGGR